MSDRYLQWVIPGEQPDYEPVEPPDDMPNAVLCWVAVPPTELEEAHGLIRMVEADDEAT